MESEQIQNVRPQATQIQFLRWTIKFDVYIIFSQNC